jgi:hypothetical protein
VQPNPRATGRRPYKLDQPDRPPAAESGSQQARADVLDEVGDSFTSSVAAGRPGTRRHAALPEGFREGSDQHVPVLIHSSRVLADRDCG